jgi:hypothetical protein
MNMSARKDMWTRYKEVFEASPITRLKDIEVLIEVWSSMWFLPDEVAYWIARGIMCPATASKMRVEELRVEHARVEGAARDEGEGGREPEDDLLKRK